MKVLVVDDSDVLRKITVYNLRKLGMDVEEAVDGIDGLEKMRSWHPDVVILDIMMPRMDGFTVLKEMKKDESIKDIPVIVLTAKGGQNDEQIALSLGAKQVMTKPFSPAQLVEEVKNVARK
ncbi:MAG: response regulator transcription factor [Fervidobacterium sp.]|jgi:two-component system chemotaxis response regulator CheY